MKNLHQKLADSTLRMESVLLLGGMLNDGEAMAGPLRDLLEEESEKSLRNIFPDLPEPLLEALVDDPHEGRYEFSSWALESGKTGFLINFARPVMTHLPDIGGCSYSWGHYQTTWIYAETIAQAVQAARKWADEREQAEKAKGEPPNAKVSGPDGEAG